jgi:hypothetical protein
MPGRDRNPLKTNRVSVTLRLAVYRESVRLSAEPLEAHEQSFFLQLNLYGYSP